jgi:hypothetical protein
MQLRDQFKGSKNWKLVTGVATAATISFGAVAIASPGSNHVPQSINLEDRAIVSDAPFTQNTGTFVPFTDLSADDTDDNSISALSPGDTDDNSISVQAADDSFSPDSPDTPDTPDSLDSPDDSASLDSPDDSASLDSPDDSD